MSVLVSIHMVTYNHKLYVSEAIQSILNQKTNFKFELIIGDDYSIDGTRQIVLDYYRKFPEKIKLILHEKNIGAIRNSENVSAECQGSYIAYCEGDDFWHDPDKLQKQIDFLENNEDYGLVHSDFNLIQHKKFSTKLIKSFNSFNNINPPTGQIFNEILYPPSFMIKTCTTCFRSELLKNYFDYSIVKKRKWQLDDLPLWLDIASKSKIGYINESLASYRLVPESVSRTKNYWSHHKFHKSVFDIRFYYWKKFSHDPEIKKGLEKYYNLMLLGDAYRMRDKELANKAYKYFKDHNLDLPIKHKAKYWAINCRIFRSFLDKAIKVKNYLR